MPKLVCVIVVITSLCVVVNAECSLGKQPILMKGWTGKISSPGFDSGMYPERQNCTWEITVSRGSRIRLTFKVFDLEVRALINLGPGKGKPTCNDIVKIEDSDKTLFEECGHSTNLKLLESKTNRVVIMFLSDESDFGKGFQLDYEGICNNTITAEGILDMPNFPNSPPPGVTCRWKFRGRGKVANIIELGDRANNLPKCGLSPLLAYDEKGYSHEICLTDSIAFSRFELTLTYELTDGKVPWMGSLSLEHDTDLSCKRFCSKIGSKTCVNPRALGAKHRCICRDGVTGNNCETSMTSVDPCYSQPCLNGLCSQEGDSFRCACQAGYNGTYCEDDVDECASILCNNGGSCNNIPGSYECACADGYTGNHCNTDIDKCRSSPCSLNSSCINEIENYRCQCQEGFSGNSCEINIIDCSPDSCMNNGKCQDMVNAFKCQCLDGFIGKRCETALHPCDSKPCRNGGTCVRVSETFTCHCAPAYVGKICSIPKGSPHCLEHKDHFFGSGITWMDSLAGKYNIQPCPPGILGTASRKCVHDSLSPTGGRWTRPDLSECVSPKILAISKEADRLKTGGYIESVDLFDVTYKLTNATSAVRNDKGACLYPGDLALATSIAKTVSDGVKDATNIMKHEMYKQLLKTYGDVVNNLVDPETIDVWMNARTSMVGEKVSSLLLSTENLVENLMHQASRRQRRSSISIADDTSQKPVEDDMEVTTNNFVFMVQTIPTKKNGSEAMNKMMTAVVQVPNAVTNIARFAQQGDGPVHLYYARFTSLAPLLSLKEDRHNGSQNKDVSVVNSDVVSSKVLGVSESAFKKISQPVILTFELKNPSLKRNLTDYCVFMNMTARTNGDRWLQKGCTKLDSNETHVVCHCYHLTNFAILMDVYGTQRGNDEANNAALSYISYIGGCLSIVACIAAICIFEYFRLRSDRVRIHEQLGISLICVQVVFLIGFGRTENSSTPEWACKLVAILLHFFLTAMFCWMLVEGIHLYVVLVKVFKRGSHLKKYITIGWGIPLVLIGISVGVFYHKYGEGNICWLNQQMLLVCFVPTVGLVVIINTVILVIVLRVMMKSINSTAKVTVQEKSSFRMSLKAAAVLLPLLGLTWMLGFLAVGKDDTEVLYYIFTYLFTICNSFQGVVFFIFHCLLNVDVHTAYERRYSRKKKKSSHDTTLSKVRKGSDFDSYMGEHTELGKSLVNKRFSDISFIDHPPSSPFGHINLDRHPSWFEDYGMSDSEKIWQTYSLGQEEGKDDPFRSHTRQSSTCKPEVTDFINPDDASDEKPSLNTVKSSYLVK